MASLLNALKASGLLEQKSQGTHAQEVFNLRGKPVGWSHDLDRIKALPRRVIDVESDTRAAEAWSKHLGRDNPSCDCDKRWGVHNPDGTIIKGSGCIRSLSPVQGWALDEASDAPGLWGNIGVGHGKTGISLLLPMAVPNISLAVLLIPPQVKKQLIEKDYPQWAAHFRVPHLAGHYTWPDRRPVLRVITYSELQLPKNSDILTRDGVADMVILDEAHNAKDKSGTRWKRLHRARGAKKFWIGVLTGTPTDKSIREFDHLIGAALGDLSPVPLHSPTVDEWSTALDAGEYRAPMGRLVELCAPKEDVQVAFARRITETHGCIVTTSASVSSSLEISCAKAPEVPEAPLPGFEGRSLVDLIAATRRGERPDGEQAQEALTSAMWARQLASGFYSYWHFPRGEPDELIKEWLECRKAYAKEARERLKFSREFMDSPLLLWNAAARWHDGYSHDGLTYPRHHKKGPMPVWESQAFLDWRAIKDQVVHETRYKWVSDYLVDHVADWARKNVGIVWVEHHDFGVKVAQKAGLVFYDGKGKNPEFEEDGRRSIIASINANDTGKNLQKWSVNLYPNPMTSNKRWEQSLGRTHRKGQRADVVTVQVYLHTQENRRAFDTARFRADYVTKTGRSPAKLSYASINLTGAVEDTVYRETVAGAHQWFDEE